MRLHDLLVLRSASKKRELRAEPKLRRWRLSDGIFHAGNTANELTLYRRRADEMCALSTTAPRAGQWGGGVARQKRPALLLGVVFRERRAGRVPIHQEMRFLRRFSRTDTTGCTSAARRIWEPTDGVLRRRPGPKFGARLARIAELRRRISVTITSDRVDCAAIGRGQFAMHSANSRDFFRELIRAHEIARVSERNPQVS